MTDRAKIVQASTAGAIVAVVFITVITVLADLQAPLKDWLKATFTHHWVGKGILAVVVFFVVSLILLTVRGSGDSEKLRKGIAVLSWSAILGTLILLAFFLYEAFWKG